MAEPGDGHVGAARRRYGARATVDGTRCSARPVVVVEEERHRRTPAPRSASEVVPPMRTRAHRGCPLGPTWQNPDPPRRRRAPLAVDDADPAQHPGDRADPPRFGGGVDAHVDGSPAGLSASRPARSRRDPDSSAGRARTAPGSAGRCRTGSSRDPPSPGIDRRQDTRRPGKDARIRAADESCRLRSARLLEGPEVQLRAPHLNAGATESTSASRCRPPRR